MSHISMPVYTKFDTGIIPSSLVTRFCTAFCSKAHTRTPHDAPLASPPAYLSRLLRAPILDFSRGGPKATQRASKLVPSAVVHALGAVSATTAAAGVQGLRRRLPLQLPPQRERLGGVPVFMPPGPGPGWLHVHALVLCDAQHHLHQRVPYR